MTSRHRPQNAPNSASTCPKYAWRRRSVFAQLGLCLAATVAALTSPVLAETDFKFCGDWGSAEIHVIFDTSASFIDDLVVFRRIWGELMTGIGSKFKKLKIGLGSFSDKGTAPLGVPQTDYCYRTDHSLTPNVEFLSTATITLQMYNGGDDPESQLDALFYSLASDDVEWSEEDEDEDGDIVRILILATDNTYHKPGDSQLASHTGEYKGYFLLETCNEVDYPEVSDIKTQFERRRVYPVFAVTSEFIDTYTALLDELDLEAGSVQELTTDSNSVMEAIGLGVQSITCDLLGMTAPGKGPSGGKVFGSMVAACCVLAVVVGGGALLYMYLYAPKEPVYMEFDDEKEL